VPVYPTPALVRWSTKVNEEKSYLQIHGSADPMASGKLDPPQLIHQGQAAQSSSLIQHPDRAQTGNNSAAEFSDQILKPNLPGLPWMCCLLLESPEGFNSTVTYERFGLGLHITYL